ncbi:hypothetical protein [Geosporobacter ferrireducens]|uniref:Uncharacterized protein n=1 Tax=Geosporobacter ferrireducens TaxID=1424294 RepID=A0A1D8GKV4_9FIRM|nr:hypothetical protein [Geosporobacter ferrireducens]AOT71535.1 hypothetical protein Gferi_19560 [Geosporobacter ferrireducens]
MYKSFFLLAIVILSMIIGVSAIGQYCLADTIQTVKETYLYKEAAIVEKINSSNSVFQVKIDLNEGETNCFYVSKEVYFKVSEGGSIHILFKVIEKQPLKIVSTFATKEAYESYLEQYKKDTIPVAPYSKEILDEFQIPN